MARRATRRGRRPAASCSQLQNIWALSPYGKVLPVGSTGKGTAPTGACHFSAAQALPLREHRPWLPRERLRLAPPPRGTAADAKRRGAKMSSLPGCVHGRRRCASALRCSVLDANRPRCKQTADAFAEPTRRDGFRKCAHAPNRLAGASAWAPPGRVRWRPWWRLPPRLRRLRRRRRPRTWHQRRPRRAPQRVRQLSTRASGRAFLTSRPFHNRFGAASAAAPSPKPEVAPKSQASTSAPPPEARTVLVTQACPPQVRDVWAHVNHGVLADCTLQMIAVREGRGLWASTQFELQRLIGSGKTSNVYQVLLRARWLREFAVR